MAKWAVEIIYSRLWERYEVELPDDASEDDAVDAVLEGKGELVDSYGVCDFDVEPLP